MQPMAGLLKRTASTSAAESGGSDVAPPKRLKRQVSFDDTLVEDSPGHASGKGSSSSSKSGYGPVLHYHDTGSPASLSTPMGSVGSLDSGSSFSPSMLAGLNTPSGSLPRLQTPRSMMFETDEYDIDEQVSENEFDDDNSDSEGGAGFTEQEFPRVAPPQNGQGPSPVPADGQTTVCTQREVPTYRMHNWKDKWEVGPRYEVTRSLGHGSYGDVAEAVDLQTGHKVAIKRIPNILDQVVDAKRIYREVHILRQMRHQQVIRLLDLWAPSGQDLRDLYLVFEFVDTDLYKLILSNQYLTDEHIKTFLYQMLIGLKYIHSAHVIHRDIKPANILINEDCTLKICDFGLARVVEVEDVPCPPVTDPYAPINQPCEMHGRMCSAKQLRGTQCGPAPDVGSLPLPPRPRLTRQLTKHVVTRWYRAPELILLQDYTNAVDMWSLGCIFAELLSMQLSSVPRFEDRKPLFPGKTCFPLSADVPDSYSDKLDQLNVIFDVIGTPHEEDIASLGEVRRYLAKLRPKQPADLRRTYPGANPEALTLLKSMLQFNPSKRIKVIDALDHPYLSSVRKHVHEVNADMPIEMDFEDQELLTTTLKAHILQEVQHYRPVSRSYDYSYPAPIPDWPPGFDWQPQPVPRGPVAARAVPPHSIGAGQSSAQHLDRVM